MKIAIIGMGIAGTSALREWTKEQKINPSIQLTVFGDKETFGTGKAFQEDHACLLMNQAAKFTSIVPENDADFVEWIRENYGEAFPETKYYPRAKFGAYISDRMNGWLAESNAEIVKEKVESIQILANKQFRVSTSSFTADFDAVHLSTGTLPYKNPYQINSHAHTIADPYPMEKKLAKIPHGATVGVIGTGLTSIDVFRYTSAYRPDIKFSFFSPSGTFKTLIGNANPVKNHYFTLENIERAKAANNGTIPLETYIKWFKQELDYHGVSSQEKLTADSLGSKKSLERQLVGTSEIGIVQAVLSNITFYQTDLWMALTEIDKRVFKDRYDNALDKLQGAFPSETGKDFVKAWGSKFQVYDNLVAIEKNDESFTFKLKNDETIEIDYVINATGNNRNVSHDIKQTPLISQLVNERILQPEIFGGVQVTMPELSVVSQKYGVLHTLKAHGQLIAGIQYGNSSVRIISKSVKASVKDIVSRFEEKMV